MKSFLPCLLLVAACDSETPCEDCAVTVCPTQAPTGTQLRFSLEKSDESLLAPTSIDWLRAPFPAFWRTNSAGNPDWSDFPNPDYADFLSTLLTYASAEVDGASTNGAVHMAFDGILDVLALPTNPKAFVETDAPLQLIDVTLGSVEYGKRRPLRWHWQDEPGKYIAANTLSVAPAWGFPLREDRTYALVVTGNVKDATGAGLSTPRLLSALLGDPEALRCITPAPTDAMQSGFWPLRQFLASAPLADGVVAATVFRTQHVTRDLASVYGRIPTPVLRPEALATQPGHENDIFHVVEGTFTTPNYQSGEVPYVSDGQFARDEEGLPQPVRNEDIRFVLTIPKVASPLASGCYPIVEIAHGTGGSAYSFVDDTGMELATRGIAAIGIDQPLHGPRNMGMNFNLDIMTFNYLNPAAFRTNFRQSAIDTFSLTHFVREALAVPAAQSPTGGNICFDTSRVGFFGHSQGGLSGAIAAAFEKHLDSFVISGAGGGTSITVMERKDPVDIARLIALTLWMGPQDEDLHELHPVLTLVQTLADIADPINYSPYWIADQTYAPARNFFVTSGTLDHATPYRTANAMAVAARVPMVAPVAMEIPEYGWLGLAAQTAPVTRNVGDRTAGFLQWTSQGGDASHFVIYHRPEAVESSMRFLRSGLLDSAARIERAPFED